MPLPLTSLLTTFQRWRHERRTLHDLERLDERSRRELAQLLDYAKSRADQEPVRSNSATSSRWDDQMKLSIGCTAVRQ